MIPVKIQEYASFTLLLGNATVLAELTLECTNTCPAECRRIIFDMTYNQVFDHDKRTNNGTSISIISLIFQTHTHGDFLRCGNDLSNDRNVDI